MLTVILGVSNRRFTWLANFIEDRKPDVIIDIGDFGDFNSIGRYAKGTKQAWGLSFKRDTDAFRDASRRAFGNIRDIKGYSPKLVRFGGNHEEGRIEKLINDNPELEGSIGLKDLGLKDFGAEYVPFKSVKVIDGIAYSHYFYDKDSRYPLLNARAVLTKKLMSSAFGHTHLRDFTESVSSDGRRIVVTNVGCYLDPQQKLDYAGPQGNARWWRGLVMFNDVFQGSYDPEFLGIERIQREYS